MKLEDSRRERSEYAKKPDENFVGRKKELADFRERLKHSRTQPVWCLYGVGGVGKSELLKYLVKGRRRESLACACIDLSHDLCRSEAGLLKEIVCELGEPEFPNFRREHRKIEPEQKGLPIGHRLRKVVGAVGTGAGGVVAAVGHPVEGAAIKAGGELAGSAMEYAGQRFVGESANRLFEAFFRDLQNYTARPTCTRPVVLAFDTYEKASELQGEILRCLVWECSRKCPEALFIIAGRDPLDWEKLDEGRAWRDEKLIASQPVDDLPDDEADAYLAKRGITDHDLAGRILKLTRRFPMFLRMACDIVDLSPADQASIAREFPEEELDQQKITEFLMGRIIERLPEKAVHLEKAVKLLGIPRWFDKKIFVLLVGKNAIEADTDWRTLTGTSLVKPPEKPGRFKFYDCIRDALQSWWKAAEEDEKVRLHKALADWHGKRTNELDHLREWFYHRAAYESLDAIRVWSALCRLALASGRIALLDLLLADVSDYPIGYESLTPEQAAEIHVWVGYAFSSYPAKRASIVTEAIRRCEAALRVYTEKDFPQDWATTQNNLGNAYTNLPTGDKGENLTRAIQCYEAALRVRTEKDFPQDWADTKYNLGLACLRLACHFADAEALSQAKTCFLDSARGSRAVADEAKAMDAESRAAKVEEFLREPTE